MEAAGDRECCISCNGRWHESNHIQSPDGIEFSWLSRARAQLRGTWPGSPARLSVLRGDIRQTRSGLPALQHGKHRPDAPSDAGAHRPMVRAAIAKSRRSGDEIQHAAGADSQRPSDAQKRGSRADDASTVAIRRADKRFEPGIFAMLFMHGRDRKNRENLPQLFAFAGTSCQSGCAVGSRSANAQNRLCGCQNAGSSFGGEFFFGFTGCSSFDGGCRVSAGFGFSKDT